MSNWCVLTAGPCAGKTSTIRELLARGYNVAPEASRLVIDQKISEGYDDPQSHEDFPQWVEKKDRQIERRLERDASDVVFLDRSLADNIAYQRLFNGGTYQSLVDECIGRYQTVFLLEQLPLENDYARKEDEETAREIHEELRTTYEDLGYDVVEVPVMPIDERVDFVVKNMLEKVVV